MRQVAERRGAQVLVEGEYITIEIGGTILVINEAEARWLQMVALPAAFAFDEDADPEQIDGQTVIPDA